MTLIMKGYEAIPAVIVFEFGFEFGEGDAPKNIQ